MVQVKGTCIFPDWTSFWSCAITISCTVVQSRGSIPIPLPSCCSCKCTNPAVGSGIDISGSHQALLNSFTYHGTRLHSQHTMLVVFVLIHIDVVLSIEKTTLRHLCCVCALCNGQVEIYIISCLPLFLLLPLLLFFNKKKKKTAN